MGEGPPWACGPDGTREQTELSKPASRVPPGLGLQALAPGSFPESLTWLPLIVDCDVKGKGDKPCLPMLLLGHGVFHTRRNAD